MEFKDFKLALQKQFDSMVKDNNKLFLTDVERNDLWDFYLDSFPEGTNPIYKERREYDCNGCKQFIRPFGNVVSIIDNELVSIWDIKNIPTPFKEVAAAMSKLVKSNSIKNVFISTEKHLGIDSNKQLLDEKVITWEHFYYKLPDTYITKSNKSIESVQGGFRDSKNVFERSMKELTLESGKVILELIDQNSLYRGEEHKANIQTFIKYKKEYDKIKENKKDNWCWKESFNNPVSRIRNSAIGTMLVDLSEGMELDQVVARFEKVVAPTNYKRPKAIFTKRMIEEAETKIEELGFADSLERRFAQLEDVTVNNILFVNRDVKKKLKNSVFDELKEEVPISKKFDKVEEINIKEFISDILPTTTNIELMIENKHSSNFMSLIAPKNGDTVSSMFKWNNNFSWAYNGDIADSMKQNIKKAGGNVEGVLRFSIQWNTGEFNGNDFDAHCIEPKGNLIFFSHMLNPDTTGVLDVDITSPRRDVPAVENITWSDKNKMEEGTYKFIVHNFAHNGGRDGFSAEIEYDGQIHSFEYDRELKQDEQVLVAEIVFDKEKGIKFVKSLDSSVSSKEIWGIKTNVFSKVNVTMFSPNYWDDQDSKGNKHYFFFLEGCENETTPRGFFNEFLNEELTKHKKVFEALGSKMRVEESNNQLSGLGFSSTQRNSILAKIEGSFSRVIKIIF